MDISQNSDEKRPATDAAARHRDSIGSALAAAGRDIVADARRALTTPDLSPAQAVHDIRKALKRWRALMRLLDEILGEPADVLRREARTLMRNLAGARDAQACLDALDDLRNSGTELPPTSVKSIQARLTDMKAQAETQGFSDAMRARLSRYLDDALLSLERWPLEGVPFSMIAGALTATYRRARQLVPEDWSGADAGHLHDLRRRVVEHRHQMDLIEHLWPRLGQLWAEEAQRLRNRLGACQDLYVLEQMAAPRQPLARWRSRLAPMIVDRRAAHLRTAARVAGRLFAEKPKAFRRRITKLWDHAQPAKQPGQTRPAKMPAAADHRTERAKTQNGPKDTVTTSRKKSG